MQYEGRIIKILPEETVGQNAIPKRMFIIEEVTDRDYKGSLAIDLFKEKIELLNGYKEGDVVTVYLNARTREYNGKWYNSITAWKIEGAIQDAQTPPPAEEDDGLPF